MSFSLKVKDELVKVVPPARHCPCAMSNSLYLKEVLPTLTTRIVSFLFILQPVSFSIPQNCRLEAAHGYVSHAGAKPFP